MSVAVQLYSAIETETKRIITIEEVDAESNGLKCGCECPVCGGRLVAKKNHRTPHFAHHSGVKAECEWAHESMLHLRAKQILEKTKRMVFPKLDVHVETPWIISTLTANESGLLELDRVELEPPKEGFKPDLCVYIHDVPCYIEICVTHPVPPEKLEKVANQGVSMLEVDLSDVPRNVPDAELTKILETEPERMTWLYNRKADLIKQREIEKIKARRKAATTVTLDGRYDRPHGTQWVRCPLNNTCYTPFTPFCVRNEYGGHFFLASERCEHFLGFLGKRPDPWETMDWFKGKFLCDASPFDEDCDCQQHQSCRRRNNG